MLKKSLFVIKITMITMITMIVGAILGVQTVFAVQSKYKPVGAPTYCNGQQITIWGKQQLNIIY